MNPYKYKILFLLLCLSVLSAVSANGEIRIPLNDLLFDKEAFPGCIEVAPAGQIYIADKKNYRINIFSGKGKLLATAGSRGEGPGEFKKWFGEFAVDARGNIFQADFFRGNQRITAFSPRGDLQKTIRINTLKNSGAYCIFVLKDGNFLLGLTDRIIVDVKGDLTYMGMEMVFSIVDRKGNILDKLATEKVYFSFSDKKGGGWPNIPFLNHLLAAYSPLDNTVIFQLSASDRFKVLDLDTKKIATLENKLAMEKLTAADYKKFLAREKEENRDYKMVAPFYEKYFESPYKIAEYKPMVRNILVNPEGEFFIAGYRDKDEKYQICKFSRRGVFIGQEISPRLPYFIDAKNVYYLVYDEDEDLHYLTIVGKGDFF